MKALVKYALGRENVGIRELPEPEPKNGELKVKVLAAGICGGDIYAIDDKRPGRLPVTLGHEYVGRVVKTCGDVGDFKIGDHVVTLPACYSCGKCELCKSGQPTLCKQRKSIGLHEDGAMAEYLVVPASYSFHVPENVLPDITDFAGMEPLCCAEKGIIETIHVKPSDIVVVNGPGTIGLYAVQCLEALGAYVIVNGLPSDAHRLKKALEIGANEVCDNPDDLKKAVYARNYRGADVCVECSGVAPSLDVCLDMARIHGTVLQLGYFTHPVECDLVKVFNKELTYVASNSTTMQSWEDTLTLVKNKKLDPGKLISLRVPLENWREGFEAARMKTAFKVVLIP